MTLHDAVMRFLVETQDRAVELAKMSDLDASKEMGAWLSAQAVRAETIDAALANDYLVHKQTSIERSLKVEPTREQSGRVLSAEMLHDVGITGLLRSGRDVDLEALVNQVTAFLAGPNIPMSRRVLLDIDWDVEQSMNVAGWELTQPSATDWQGIGAIPLAGEFAIRKRYSVLLGHGKYVALCAPAPDMTPSRGYRIWPFAARRASIPEAWAPLLLLNLWEDSPTLPVAEYLVEPGRGFEVVYESLATGYQGHGHLYEVPQLGPLTIYDEDRENFVLFLSVMSQYLAEWLNRSPKYKNLRRFSNSALRFLEATRLVSSDGDVLYLDDDPQVIVHYVSALENLLSKDERNVDLSRRTAQRAAVLLGTDDRTRSQIYQLVSQAYAQRSAIAHGDEPKGSLHNLNSSLRGVLRGALTATIALGPDVVVGQISDTALLDHSVLESQIRGLLAALPLDWLASFLSRSPGSSIQ